MVKAKLSRSWKFLDQENGNKFEENNKNKTKIKNKLNNILN